MARQPRDPTEALLAEQRRFYDLRAPDFGDPSKPDRRVHGCMDAASIAEVVEELRPEGDVLELACGEGAFTRELVRFALPRCGRAGLSRPDQPARGSSSSRRLPNGS